MLCGASCCAGAGRISRQNFNVKEASYQRVGRLFYVWGLFLLRLPAPVNGPEKCLCSEDLAEQNIEEAGDRHSSGEGGDPCQRHGAERGELQA